MNTNQLLTLLTTSSLIHQPPSTEHKYETNVNHLNTISCSQSFTLSNNHANAIIPSTWFVNMYIFKQLEDTSSFLPKLDIVFLLDNGAFTCVLSSATFKILTENFLNWTKSTHNNNDFKIK